MSPKGLAEVDDFEFAFSVSIYFILEVEFSFLLLNMHAKPGQQRDGKPPCLTG